MSCGVSDYEWIEVDCDGMKWNGVWSGENELEWEQADVYVNECSQLKWKPVECNVNGV